MDDDRCTLKPSTTAMMVVVVVVDSKRELRDCRPVSQIKVVCNIPASRVCIPCTAACVECMQNSGNHSPRCSHLLRLPRPSPFRIIRQKKSYDSEFDVKSVFRKKSDNSLRGGRGTRYPVRRVIYIAAHDRKSHKRRSKICYFFLYI